jgi:hypothetical protein
MGITNNNLIREEKAQNPALRKFAFLRSRRGHETHLFTGRRQQSLVTSPATIRNEQPPCARRFFVKREFLLRSYPLRSGTDGGPLRGGLRVLEKR